MQYKMPLWLRGAQFASDSDFEMAVRISCVLVLAFTLSAMALNSMDSPGLRIAIRVFDECSKADGLSPCLKRKALTFLDRLGRIDKLDITDEITIVKATGATNSTPLTDDDIDKSLPRGYEARNQALTSMLWNKVTSLVGSRNIEFTMPRMSDIGFEEARIGDLDFGGGGGGHGHHGGGGGLGGHRGGGKLKGGKKGGGVKMGLIMAMMGGKMMGLISLGIAGLFLLAGKALITSKIALLLSGIIAIKKLVAAKQGGGGGGGVHGGGGGAHHVWASSGGGGEGGWDRRSLDDSHKLAYSSFTPK